MSKLPCVLAISLAFATSLRAELKLPAIISDHMVLQQRQPNPIWGWDAPGTKITVTFAGQTKSAEAGADGKWTVKLDPVPANAQPQAIAITGSSRKEIQDVLIGEVWMCAGQSNMGFTLQQDWNGDLEAAASRLPNLRLIKVPNIGSQEPQKDFVGNWASSSADTAKSFSAVGFLFGRYIHEIVGVPVGLIDNAWGGSAAEAWVPRPALEKDPRFKLLMENTVRHEAELQTPKAQEAYQKAFAQWKDAAGKAKAAGRPAPRAPESPESWLTGRTRPGNIFNGKLNPTLPYGIKGVVWYQGENNGTRGYEYRDLFPFVIEQWRKAWGQGDFPFYWVQLADYHAEVATPGDAPWAELREAQTRTLKLPHTGQAVIIDLGEGRDVHPRNKHDVAARLVRWALVKDYGLNFPFRSPEFKGLEVQGSKAIVTIDCFGSFLRPFDVVEARGFAVCGEDKVWHWAKGKILSMDKVEVLSDEVPKPIAVRYAWADNPVCNLFSNDGFPVTPFRTDDFEMISKPKPAPATVGARP